MMRKFHEFITSSDIYKEFNGKDILVKIGVSSKATLDLNDIDVIREAFKADGRIFKTKCLIHHIEVGNLILNHSYKEIKKLREDHVNNNSRVKIRGFTK